MLIPPQDKSSIPELINCKFDTGDCFMLTSTREKRSRKKREKVGEQLEYLWLLVITIDIQHTHIMCPFCSLIFVNSLEPTRTYRFSCAVANLMQDWHRMYLSLVSVFKADKKLLMKQSHYGFVCSLIDQKTHSSLLIEK